MMRRSHRRGASLAELLVLISASAVLISLCGTLLHRIFRAHNKGAVATQQERTLWRFESQLRGDIQHAKQAQTDSRQLPANTFVRLELWDSRVVEYRVEEQRIERVVLVDDKPQAREQFRFPRPVQATVSLPETNLLAVELQTQPETEPVNLGQVAPAIAFRAVGSLAGERIPSGLRLLKEGTHEQND